MVTALSVPDANSYTTLRKKESITEGEHGVVLQNADLVATAPRPPMIGESAGEIGRPDPTDDQGLALVVTDMISAAGALPHPTIRTNRNVTPRS